MDNIVSFEDFRNKTAQLNNQTNPISPQILNVNAVTNPVTTNVSADSFESLQNELTNAKKKNGLIEKIADKVKGLTNFGASSKKIEASIEDVKNNKKSKEEVEKEIKNYSVSQENIAQATGDVASGLVSIGTFFFAKQSLEKLQAKKLKINPDNKIVEDFVKLAKDSIAEVSKKTKKSTKSLDKVIDFVSKNIGKRTAAIGVAGFAATIVGGLVKSNLLKLNRIGTKQYKAEINKDMDKKEKRTIKKEAKKQKTSADFRNFITGAINGLTTPILSVLGVFGAPIYLATNSLSRYFIGNTENKKEKSPKGYIENLKATPVTHVALAATLLIPAILKGRANKIFEVNLDKVTKDLANATLEKIGDSKSSYQQLEEILFGDSKIKALLDDSGLPISERIQRLSDENIFALKFKQINSNADELARALKESCPATRTLEEAQDIVQKTFNGDYSVERLVGTGTVAETYLAKDKNGREVCIKMLKNGIDADKIMADRDKFIELIRNLEGKTAEEKEFLIKNIENIAQGVLAEVDFNNEAEAAKALAKVTKEANVVVPREVKGGIYVMEKANGVSLQNLMKYIQGPDNKWELEYHTKGLEQAKQEADEYSIDYHTRQLKRINEEIASFEKEIESLKPLGEITKEEAQKLLEKYQDVMVEQFSKVNEHGKIIHGDIHPGNIFIDIPAMRRGEKNFFTLIDTGNTIQQDSQNAIRFMNLTKYIKNADYENIAEFVLDGAKLPDGMTKEMALDAITKELKQAFFDTKTHIGHVSNDTLLSITDSIMQKLNIIPSDTQGNLMKAKTSANQSMSEFSNSFMGALFNKLEGKLESHGVDIYNADKKNAGKVALGITGIMKDFAVTKGKYSLKRVIQERKNLVFLSPAQKAKIKRSKLAPKKNSVEYLTYELKQGKSDKMSEVSSLFD